MPSRNIPEEILLASKLRATYRSNKHYQSLQRESAKVYEAILAEEKDDWYQEEGLIKDETLLASISEGIIATDNKGRIIKINRPAESLLQISADIALGQSLCDVLPLLDTEGQPLEKQRQPYWRAITSGRRVSTYNNPLFYRRPGGALFPVAITASPIIVDNSVLGVINVIRDLTHERTLEASKNEFVSLASHHLRTPLTAINWYAERLASIKDLKLSSSQRNYISEIHAATYRLNHLFSNLLVASRIQLNTLILESSPVDLTEVTEKITAKIRPLAIHKGIHLRYYRPKILPNVKADPNFLSEAIQAIIENAVTYTPSGGKITIKLSFLGHQHRQDTQKAHGQALLTVQDTGCGIPTNQQANVFTKLFRADNAQRCDTTGLGLNLFIAKWIIEQAGGEIWFDSQENIGSTFFIALPITS